MAAPPAASPRVQRRFLRDFEAGGYLDLFLVSAVSAVLVIRFYLDLAGYPQVGGARLHIAHMLWGGLFMAVALIAAFSFLDRGSRSLVAFVGGVGFGTFIDEVGKFVTQDNDYFFEPALAIMYAVFVVLYLLGRSLHREGIATREEFLVNALQETVELAVHDLSSEERSRALYYLDESGSQSPLALGLRQLLGDASLVESRPGRAERWRRRAEAAYRRVTQSPLFARVLVGFFLLQLAVGLLYVLLLIGLGGGSGLHVIHWPRTLPTHGVSGVTDVALLVSWTVATVFVGLGVAALRRSRLRAYRMFQRSILVTILFGEVFLFYREQWSALIGLAFNLLVFGALRFMIEREKNRVYREAAAPA